MFSLGFTFSFFYKLDDMLLSFCFVFGVLLESFGALGAALCALGAVLENYRFLKVGQGDPRIESTWVREGLMPHWGVQ